MATEKELELLDSYLANRLNTSEKADFEKKLNADPNLSNEFEFQKRLIAGIRNARAAELKSMLNNVPISTLETSATTSIVKVITGCVVAGLLGTGLYFFLNQEKVEKIETSIKKENEISPSKEPTDTQAIEQSNSSPLAIQKETRSVEIKEKTSSKSFKKKADSSSITTTGKVTEKRKLEVFDPTREMDNNAEQNNSETESGVIATASSIDVVTDDSNKKYTFNYQFKNGKLFLYGSFEKNLYEILEFFDESKRTVFLFYKDNYYLLDEESQKVKLLTPITDPVLLKKLKEHRGS